MNANVDISNTYLKTERLYIRPWKLEDIQDFYEYAKVDGVGQMAGWDPHSSINESEKILNLFIADKNIFALELKSNHKVIGSLGLEKICVDLGQPYTDLIGREIGYVLSKDYWGKGIMPEAVERIIQYCFEEEKYDFLQISHSIENNQSKRVIEKSGFTFIKESARTGRNGIKQISRFYAVKNENQ